MAKAVPNVKISINTLGIKTFLVTKIIHQKILNFTRNQAQISPISFVWVLLQWLLWVAGLHGCSRCAVPIVIKLVSTIGVF